jgi:hypothetical protein
LEAAAAAAALAEEATKERRKAAKPPRDAPSRRAAADAVAAERVPRRPVITNANAGYHAVQEAAARELRTKLNKKLGLVRAHTKLTCPATQFLRHSF